MARKVMVRVHRRPAQNGVRDLIGGLLPGPSSSATSSTDATTTSTTADSSDPLSGVGGALTTLLTPILPLSSSAQTSTTSLIPLTTSSITSSSTSTTLSSSSPSSTSTSSTSSSSSSVNSTPSNTPSSTPPPSTPSSHTTSADQSLPPLSTSIFLSTSADQTFTITSLVQAAATSSLAAAPASAESFLENKPLEGSIFALVGLVALAAIIGISTMALRKSKKNRLDKEALEAAFVPGGLSRFSSDDGSAGAQMVDEKRRGSASASEDSMAKSSGSGSGHGRERGDGGGGESPAQNQGQGGLPRLTHLPQQPPPSAGYAQQNLAPYPGTGQYPYGAYQPQAYSPVPPRSPNPPFDAPHSQNPVYDSAGQQQQQLSVGPYPPGPNGGGAAVHREPSTNKQMAGRPERLSLLNGRVSTSSSAPSSSPTTPTATGTGTPVRRRFSSHSRELNPNMSHMPVAPPLPAKFGSDESFADEDAYSQPRALKIANE